MLGTALGLRKFVALLIAATFLVGLPSLLSAVTLSPDCVTASSASADGRCCTATNTPGCMISCLAHPAAAVGEMPEQLQIACEVAPPPSPTVCMPSVAYPPDTPPPKSFSA